MRTYHNRKNADQETRKWEPARDQGPSMDASKIRLAAYLQEWLNRAAKHVRPSTFTDYHYTTEHYLLPRVGGLTLRGASPKAMQAIID